MKVEHVYSAKWKLSSWSTTSNTWIFLSINEDTLWTARMRIHVFKHKMSIIIILFIVRITPIYYSVIKYIRFYEMDYHHVKLMLVFFFFGGLLRTESILLSSWTSEEEPVWKKLQSYHTRDGGLFSVILMFDTIKVQLHMLCYFWCLE